MNSSQRELPVSRNEAYRDILVNLLLTVITCGLYNIYWNYREMLVVNGLLKREEFNFATWLLFSFLTCGIYHMFYEYRMGLAIQEIQEMYGQPKDPNLPVVSLGLSIFGLTVVADAIQQHFINKLYD